MGTTKKTRKKYHKPKQSAWNPDRPMYRTPWKVDAVFAPIYKFVRELMSTGNVDEDVATGQTVFSDPHTGNTYALTPALRGLLEMMELHAKRKGTQIATAGLNSLVSILDNGGFASESVMKKCITELENLEQMALKMTAGEAEDALKTVQIQIALEEAKAP
ncbi:hypothetical protein [Uliginosibacterium sediminicola]|uniref:Uncharacterized protein n=1 Tax=Uliginosibacterium sediminicola TaxID=2024550 RepID=A0ABU9YW96_9RHOO